MGNPTQWRQAVSGEAAWKKGIFELLQLPGACCPLSIPLPISSVCLFLSLSFLCPLPGLWSLSTSGFRQALLPSQLAFLQAASFFFETLGSFKCLSWPPNPQPMSEVGLAILSSHLFRKNTNPIILSCHTCGSGCMTLCICGPEYYLANVIYYPVMMMLLMMMVVGMMKVMVLVMRCC